jgi:uncharacterized protein YdcH (DUF465 family)
MTEVKLPTEPFPYRRLGAATPLKEACPRMERNSQEDIKAHLMQTNEQFRHMAEQHREYKRLVEQLEAKHYLTQQEEAEEHRLKKLKLHLKDQMEQLMSQHRTQHVS